MPDLEKQIAEWRQEMSGAGIRNPEVLDELEAHLREQVAHLQGIGLSEPEQFQIAIGRMGEIRAIKQEFSKVNPFRFCLPQNNPVELNFLGVCFMLLGLHVFTSGTRMIFLSRNSYTGEAIALMSIVLLLLGGLHFFVSIGLRCRRNFWRYFAFAVAALQAFCNIYGLVTRLFGPATNDPSGERFIFMGVVGPIRYQWIASLLILATMVWGCVYLSKPSVRSLFRVGAKTRIA